MTSPALTVAVLDDNIARFRAEFVAALPAGATAVFPDASDDRSVREALRDAQVLVSGAFDAETAAAAKDLRLLLVPGAGLNGVEWPAVPTDVPVCNTFHPLAPVIELVKKFKMYVRVVIL